MADARVSDPAGLDSPPPKRKAGALPRRPTANAVLTTAADTQRRVWTPRRRDTSSELLKRIGADSCGRGNPSEKRTVEDQRRSAATVAKTVAKALDDARRTWTTLEYRPSPQSVTDGSGRLAYFYGSDAPQASACPLCARSGGASRWLRQPRPGTHLSGASSAGCRQLSRCSLGVWRNCTGSFL